MEQNEKPYQFLAWLATSILIIAAALASFVPELEYHHWAFISANTCLLYTSPSPRDVEESRMPSSA